MAFDNTLTALNQVGGLVTRRLAQGLQEANAIASGQLEESISFRAFSNSNQLGVEVSMLDYWEYVDEGRRAGKMPPVSKIQEWLTYPNVRSKIQQGRDQAVQDPESVAFLIARKIAREGTKGTDFATNVFNSTLVQKEIPALIESSIGEDIEATINETLNIQ